MQAEATPVERLLELIAASTETFARLLEAALPRIDAADARAGRRRVPVPRRVRTAPRSSSAGRAAGRAGGAGARRCTRCWWRGRSRSHAARPGASRSPQRALTRSRSAPARCWSWPRSARGWARAHVAAALADLDAGCDVVYGPTLEGDWYLAALAQPRAELLAGNPFTVAREHGAEVGLLRHERAAPHGRRRRGVPRRPAHAGRRARGAQRALDADRGPHLAGDAQVRVAEAADAGREVVRPAPRRARVHAVVARDALDRAGERAEVRRSERRRPRCRSRSRRSRTGRPRRSRRPCRRRPPGGGPGAGAAASRSCGRVSRAPRTWRSTTVARTLRVPLRIVRGSSTLRRNAWRWPRLIEHGAVDAGHVHLAGLVAVDPRERVAEVGARRPRDHVARRRARRGSRRRSGCRSAAASRSSRTPIEKQARPVRRAGEPPRTVPADCVTASGAISDSSEPPVGWSTAASSATFGSPRPSRCRRRGPSR